MATRYGTARQVEQVGRELETFESIQNDPYKFGSIDRKDEFRKNKAKLEKQKAAITPPPVTDTERDRLVKRQAQLAEFIRNPDPSIRKPAMPSIKEMWDMPAGVVGAHRKWEQGVKKYTVDASGKVVPAQNGYGAESEYKDNQRRLYGDEQLLDPDIGSIEMLRSADPASKSLIDYPRMNFSQGAGVSEEQWNATVGPRPPMANPPAAAQKPKREPLPPPTEAEQCTASRKDGSKCTARKARGRETCLAHSRAKTQ